MLGSSVREKERLSDASLPKDEQTLQATIVIPAFNEEDAIGTTLEELIKLNIHKTCEIIVVNDGSTDKTPEVVSSFDVKLINHLTNKGYGASLKNGIRAARAEKIVIMDSDGQHSPEYLPKIIQALDQYPMVLGERTKDSHQVKNRQLGKRIIRIIGEYLLEQELPDYNSGLRGFKRKTIISMLHLMPNGFSFSTTSTLAFIKNGYEIYKIPIKVKARVGRKSNVKFIKDGSKTILLIFRIIMLFNPLKIFIPSGIFCIILGAIFGMIGFTYFGHVSIGSAITIIFGFFLIFNGLISDQISMINMREDNGENEKNN